MDARLARWLVAAFLLASSACSTPAAPKCPQLTCAEDELCVVDRCVSTRCGARQCRAGEACLKGFCSTPACADVTCALGQVCVAGACFEKDCGGQTCTAAEVCLDQRCVDTGCLSSEGQVTACGTNDRCVAGACRSNNCTGVTCPAQSVCVSGRCENALCVGVQCPAMTACANGGCLPTSCGGTTCSFEQVCQSSSCVDRGCLGVTCPVGSHCGGGACLSDSGCQPGCAATETCIANTCYPNGCAGTACGTGEVCVANVCTDQRCVGVSCGAGSRCVAGACMPLGGCQPACAATETCVGTTCYPNACAAQTCSAGQVCVGLQCTDTRCVGVTCSTAGEVCNAGTCARGCFIAGSFITEGTVDPANPCAVCDPSSDVTTWSPRAMSTACTDDGNACTDDVCDTSATCVHLERADDSSCGAVKFCLSGVCLQGCSIAATDVPDGKLNPNNECQRCVATTSTSAWTSEPNGLSCTDDGNPCTTDACNLGACGHDAVADGTVCGTSQACVAGQCVTGCTIGNEFFPNGTINPSNDCQVCNAAALATGWSARNNGTACADDGNSCTTDTCTTGACVHTNLPNGAMCAGAQICNAGSCGAGCNIANVFYANGTTNPANPCQSCQSAVSTTAWSPKSNGTTCTSDNNPCTLDQCNAGTCAHPPDAAKVGTACTGTNFCSGTTRHYNFQCNASGVCASASTQACPTASNCQTGGGCSAGACVALSNKAQGTACSGVTNGMCCTGTCVNRGQDPNCGICGLNCGGFGCAPAVGNTAYFVCDGVSANASCTANYGSAATAFNNQCNCQCASGTSCSPGGKCPVCHDVTGTNYCTY